MNNELEKTEQSVIKADNTISKSQSTTLTIGMVLDGKYEIKREIARGGMGIIYESYHKIFKRKVAIKIIFSDKIGSLQLRRFQKEVLAYVNLSHPNVIKIYDAGIYKNNPYIVMEYINGVNICKYVAQDDKNYRKQKEYDTDLGIQRDWKLCAKLIYKIALALEYIHKKNMLHRDIKPSNIIVRSDGTPVIIDLGLVKFQSENNASLTRTGELLGTLQYMPIEQAQGKHHGVDERSDIYSLGLVLYELLTGEMAYSGKNPMEICYKIMSYYPPFPREINPQIPEELDKITMHAIEKKKENRYATAQEFADALKKYLYEEHTQETKKHNDDKKRVQLQWNNKHIIECFIALLVVIIAIIFIIPSKTDNKTGQIPPPSKPIPPIPRIDIELELYKIEEKYNAFKIQHYDSLWVEIDTKGSELDKDKQQCKKLRKLQTNLEIQRQGEQEEYKALQDKLDVETLKGREENIMILSKLCNQKKEEECALNEYINMIKNELSSKREKCDLLQNEINEKKTKGKQLQDKLNNFWTNYNNCKKNFKKKSLTEKEIEIQQLQKQLNELQQYK